MRPLSFALAPALGFACLLPVAALAQDGVECEYRNPDNPNWNYLRSCTLRTVEDGGRVTTTASVSNGSTLTIVEEGTGAVRRFTINGYEAALLEDGASRCFLTIDDEETICLHGVAAAASATAPEAGPAPAEATAPTDGAVAALGGGEPGHCLAWVDEDEREGLIGQGPCTRRTDCAEVEGAGGMSCLIDFVWTDGRETVVTSRDGVHTLDGAVALPGEGGCFTDDGAGLHFCFSTAPMTEAAYPALALAPAPEPEPVVAAPAVAAQTPAEPPAATGHRCSFLRDEVEVSSWACTETVACDDPVCTVTYAFENGTTVTLDTADGRVMLMNGAKADPAVWAEGAGVDVTRPGAPYVFRFTPGTTRAAVD